MSSVMGAVVFAAFALGYLLAVSGLGKNKKEKAQDGNPENQRPTKKENRTLWRRSLHSRFTHYERNRHEHYYHRNPNMVWSIRTFWAIFIYTGVTFVLLVVSYCSLNIAKDTERRQLRAYIFPDQVMIYNVDGDVTRTAKEPPKLEVVIKNTGITPGYAITNLVAGVILSFPTITSPADIPMSENKYRNRSVSTLPAGGVEISYSDIVGAEIPLTAAQKKSLNDGEKAIYLFGEIIYRDAFDIVRCTRYVFYVGGDAGFNGTTMKHAGQGEEADKNCREPQIVKPFPLPVVPHHQF